MVVVKKNRHFIQLFVTVAIVIGAVELLKLKTTNGTTQVVVATASGSIPFSLFSHATHSLPQRTHKTSELLSIGRLLLSAFLSYFFGSVVFVTYLYVCVSSA